jgi:hypothetical protein
MLMIMGVVSHLLKPTAEETEEHEITRSRE